MELVERNYSITIDICLLEQVLPENTVHFAAPIAVEMFVEVFDGNHVVLVRIENTESSPKLTLIGQNSSINTSRNELLKVDLTVPIKISGLKNLVPVDISSSAHFAEFRFVKSAWSIGVQPDELSL